MPKPQSKVIQAILRDARRYRYLRTKAYVGGVVGPNGEERFWTTVMCLPCDGGESFDRCVDAAMKRHSGDQQP